MRRDGFPEFTQLVERPDAFRGLGQLLQRLGHIVHQLVRRGGVDGLLDRDGLLKEPAGVATPHTGPAPVIVKPGANEASNAVAAATITPFPFGELAKFLEMAAQAFTEVGELIMKSAEAWAVGFVELITGLVNFEPWLVLTGMIDMFFATVGFALGVFVLVPLLEFAVVLELAILSIGWIISNIFGAIPVLAGPLLGALAAAVVPGVNRPGESGDSLI